MQDSLTHWDERRGLQNLQIKLLERLEFDFLIRLRKFADAKQSTNTEFSYFKHAEKKTNKQKKAVIAL